MKAAFLLIPLLLIGCGGGGDGGDCVALTGGGQLAEVRIPSPQVHIEARIVLVNHDSFANLGLDYSIVVPAQKDAGGSLGGVSRQGRDVVADGDTLGSTAGVPYLVTNGFDGFLSIVNLDFISPFEGEAVKIFPTLPFAGQCVTINDSQLPIQNFAGGAGQPMLSPNDPGLDGDFLVDFPDATALGALLASLAGDTRNKVLSMPEFTVFDGQRTIATLQDMNPAIGDLTPPFRTVVQAVTPAPFGIFTGVTLDVRPVIVGTSVEMEVRFGTQALSFFRSIPAEVGGQPVDVEIPVLAPGIVRGDVTVADGQTVVIGDFLQTGQSATERGVPVLGQVPVLGSLFRNHSDDTQNLMIVITPTIIPAAD